MSLTSCGHWYKAEWFDWTGKEKIEGKQLCSACGPEKFNKGKPTKCGEWHGKFDRVFLPMGMFKTNRLGNLEHIESGSEDFRSYELPVMG